MKKKLFNVSFIICVLSLAFSCRSAKNGRADENFDEFYEKFLTDSSFQMERIQFPLKGIKADEGEDSTYYWHKEDWVMLKKPNLDGTDFKRDLQVSDTVATDEIFMENAGFYFKMVYEPIKRKWHLVYMIDGGL
ncbi:DUF4348 domain-containing protein [Porifericola rhodea]|uniref:DUF4348 domain-containing protein n=1 Tax=Porifericola rhodea TaxID=930972 RepID=UPI002666A25E|nr:DUF4348 domain-containing protein [Porifericola rhodea]WKN32614.1 DUF4348 domain-containing protein [Porifericola rhodea]